MIAALKPPKNKHELAKAILSLKNTKIEVIDPKFFCNLYDFVTFRFF